MFEETKGDGYGYIVIESKTFFLIDMDHVASKRTKNLKLDIHQKRRSLLSL